MGEDKPLVEQELPAHSTIKINGIPFETVEPIKLMAREGALEFALWLGLEPKSSVEAGEAYVAHRQRYLRG